jgi:hypothetical protein
MFLGVVGVAIHYLRFGPKDPGDKTGPENKEESRKP